MNLYIVKAGYFPGSLDGSVIVANSESQAVDLFKEKHEKSWLSGGNDWKQISTGLEPTDREYEKPVEFTVEQIDMNEAAIVFEGYYCC